MLECTFTLNDQPMSILRCGANAFPAFYGLGANVNQRSAACAAGVGPIPPGRYYIFDRQSGGWLGSLRDALSGRDQWFALYVEDAQIDDRTLCDAIERGNFRLHPKDPLGISKGCITLENLVDFQRLRALLTGSPMEAVPGSSLKAYGRVTVE